ncbi:MAG: EsaB/YukD family protein, partial [Anaerolineales bacterium]|nr:EsaB/YukD family protein [Anaerolineales bacterium]
MFVRVTLYDPAAQAHQVELPAAEPIGRILPVLIRRLRLPETDGGNPLQYDLYRAGAPEPLKPVATLHMAGITHGAALELRAAIDPYARVTEEELKARETHYRTARTPRRWRDYQAQIGLGLLAVLAL